MKKTGFIIVLIGVAFTVLTTLSLLMKERVTDGSQFKVEQAKIHHRIWEPMAGAIVLVVGAGIYMAGKKGKAKTV
jgi:hypothetical protein